MEVLFAVSHPRGFVMRRIAATLATLAFALAVPLAVAGSASAAPQIPPGYITDSTCVQAGGFVVTGTNGIHYCEGGIYDGLPVIVIP
jgi:hypothetical protein